MAQRSRSAAPARRMCARSEISRRWASLVVLGVLAGAAGGLSVAAVAGARRTNTVYSRWRAATAAPDAIVFGTQVGASDVDYSRVERLPEVAAAGKFELAGITVTHIDGVGNIAPGQLGTLAPGDTQLFRTVAQPLLRHGRLPNPHRDDEIVVNNAAAKRWHLHVDQHADIAGARNLDSFYGAPPQVAVRRRVTIVGIGNSAMDTIFGPNDPGFFPSGAFIVQHADVIEHAPNLVVRLKPGTDVDAFHRRAVRLLRDPHVPAAQLLNAPVRDLAEDGKRVTHATDLEQNGLLLFALAVALAGLVLIGQAVARAVYAISESNTALRALGLTRLDCTLALMMPMVVTAVAAAITTIVVAIAASPDFPVGLGRQFEPDLGFHADWTVLLIGVGAAALLVGLCALLAAWRATFGVRHATRQSNGIASRLSRGSALPIAFGAGLALDAGRGERSLPVRPAMTSAVAGALSIIAALGLVHGIDDALAKPSRAGQVWDLVVYPDSLKQFRSMPHDLAALPEVGSVAYMRHANADVNGAGLPIWDIERVRGPLTFVVLSGRAPRAGETLIGPSTARALHLHVGSVVHAGDGAHRVTLRVSGKGLLPESPHSSFDQGLWVRPDTMRRMYGPPGADGVDEAFVVKARSGTSHAALQRAMTRHGFTDVETATQPQDVLFLKNVRTLPIALAVFLIALSIAALGHALVTAVRRRRHDLAILKAIGFRPRQSALSIASLATTVGIVGLVLGIPLGIACGRLVWHWVAARTPLVYVAPFAAAAVVVLVPSVLLVANALAAWPARRAARLRPAEVLRTE